MRRIVWMSVASVLFVIAAIISAAVSWPGSGTNFVIAAGAGAIATAILATREK